LFFRRRHSSFFSGQLSTIPILISFPFCRGSFRWILLPPPPSATPSKFTKPHSAGFSLFPSTSVCGLVVFFSQKDDTNPTVFVFVAAIFHFPSTLPPSRKNASNKNQLVHRCRRFLPLGAPGGLKLTIPKRLPLLRSSRRWGRIHFRT